VPAPPESAGRAPLPAAGREIASTYYGRGYALLQQDHVDEAIEQLNEAVKLNPTLAPAYNARGYAQYRLRHFAEALADFDVAILLSPAYANAYLNRSYARRAIKDIAGADADAAKASKLTTKSGK
jgi:tetratricopeptide (TPR) repeat protein